MASAPRVVPKVGHARLTPDANAGYKSRSGRARRTWPRTCAGRADGRRGCKSAGRCGAPAGSADDAIVTRRRRLRPAEPHSRETRPHGAHGEPDALDRGEIALDRDGRGRLLRARLARRIAVLEPRPALGRESDGRRDPAVVDARRRCGPGSGLWMASPEHRAVILDGSWREVGIGAVHADAASGMFLGRAVTVITTDFGAMR